MTDAVGVLITLALAGGVAWVFRQFCYFPGFKESFLEDVGCIVIVLGFVGFVGTLVWAYQ